MTVLSWSGMFSRKGNVEGKGEERHVWIKSDGKEWKEIQHDQKGNWICKLYVTGRERM